MEVNLVFESAITNLKPKFEYGKTAFELLSNSQEHFSQYMMIDGNKIPVHKLKDYDTRTRVTVIDNKQRRVPLRYLRDCDEIVQEIQIKKHKREANEKYDPSSRVDLKFKAGFIYPQTEVAYNFLWELPEHNLYPENLRPNDVSPMFKLHQPEIAKKENVKTVLLQRKCLNYISDITDADNGFENWNDNKVRTLFIALFGSLEVVPESKDDIFNKFISKCDNDITEQSEIVLLIEKFLEQDKNKKATIVNESKQETLEKNNKVDEVDANADVDDLLEQILGRAIENNVVLYAENEVKVNEKLKIYNKVFSAEKGIAKEDLHGLFKGFLKTKEGEQTLSIIKTKIKWDAVVVEAKQAQQ